MFSLRSATLCLATLVVVLAGNTASAHTGKKEERAVPVELIEIHQGNKCLNFTPTFCDMVDWKVAGAKLNGIENTELMIEMSFYNQPGTWACRKEFKEFQCRIMFPKCDGKVFVKPPCRKSCEQFSLRCPGSNVACDDLTDEADQCYSFDYTKQMAEDEKLGKPTPTLKGWPSALIGGAVLSIFLGLGFHLDKKKNGDYSEGATSDEQNRLLPINSA